MVMTLAFSAGDCNVERAARLSLANMLSGMLSNRQNAPFNCRRCMMCTICKTDDTNSVCASDICTDKCGPGSRCQMEKKCKDLSASGCDSCLQDMDCVYNTENDSCLLGETAPMVNGIVFMEASCPAASMNACSAYSDCSSCMANESEACLFDKADNTCYFGETAPMVMTLAFSAGDCNVERKARLSLANMLSGMLSNRQNAPFNCRRCMMCTICKTDDTNSVCASEICTDKC